MPPHENAGFGTRSSQLELYQMLIGEVNKSVDRVAEDLRTNFRDAMESMEKKTDDNYRLLSSRIDENRSVARSENERVVAKIDQIVAVLGEGNARFAVLEQRVSTVESAEENRRNGHHRRPTTDPFPTSRPVEAPKKMNPLVVALLGAVAAAFGGAVVTWIISGGLTVTPHSGAASAVASPKP